MAQPSSLRTSTFDKLTQQCTVNMNYSSTGSSAPNPTLTGVCRPLVEPVADTAAANGPSRCLVKSICQSLRDRVTTPFIEPSDLKHMLLDISQRFFVIVLDCRTFTDFNMQHIKESVHLNCRDKLIRRRLASRKLQVKDLIACESTKSKIVDNSPPMAKSNAHPSSCSLANLNLDENENAQNMIVLYDNTTADVKDLEVEQNPLRIVQENIKQSGYKKQCKILKGGFQQFQQLWPEFCVQKGVTPIKQSSMYYDAKMTADQNQSAIDSALMTPITSFLYLGNERDAADGAALERAGIRYILNLTCNVPFYNTANKNYVFKRIAVNDCHSQNLQQFFTEAFDFIEEARANKSKVLVHCQAGISRSPTIVIAYLMYHSHLSMAEANSQVKKLRSIIAPNLIFVSQLLDYEAQLLSQKRQPVTPEPTINPLSLCRRLSSTVVQTNICDELNSDQIASTTDEDSDSNDLEQKVPVAQLHYPAHATLCA